MIKASAIAGAAAWTAPVIIDSLASPAAAGTGPCVKYYRAKWSNSTGTWTADGANGQCGIGTTFNGHPLNVNPPPSFPTMHNCETNSAGFCYVSLPPGCGQWQLVRPHYGQAPACTPLDGNCYDVPLDTACSSVPPTGACGCTSGDDVYFPRASRSDVIVVWCC
jgi:hypothetical protein